MKKILGYIFFVPIFLLTNVLCNNILAPTLEFFFRMMSLAVTTPPNFFMAVYNRASYHYWELHLYFIKSFYFSLSWNQ